MAEYIERESALKLIEKRQSELLRQRGCWSRHELYGRDRDTFDTMDEISDLIDNMPAAEVTPVRRGRWVKKEDSFCYWHVCSECGVEALYNEYEHNVFSSFCPHCGAKMDAY